MLQAFENADKFSKYPDKCTQPDGKTPAGASATSYQVLALGDPHTALFDTANYESVSTDTVDSKKGSGDPHTNGTWQVVKSKKLHC
jgi:C-terminal processing protease CtpA/Prc